MDYYVLPLAELMEQQTKKQLLINARLLKIKLDSHLKKKAIAEMLAKSILLTPKRLLDRLSREDVIRLQEMVHARKKGIRESFYILVDDCITKLGLCDFYPAADMSCTYIFIYPDLIEALEPLIDTYLSSPKRMEEDRKRGLVSGILHLYGFVSLHDLFNCYKKYEPEADIDELYDIVNDSFFLAESLDLDRMVFSSPFRIVDYEKIAVIPTQQYADFTEAEVLAVGVSDFPLPDSKHLKKLFQSFEKHGKSEEAQEVLSYAWLCSQNGSYPFGVIDEIFEPSQSYEIMRQLVDYLNDAPRWSLKGNTPNNVRDQQQKMDVAQRSRGYVDALCNKVIPDLGKSVGRNDPCPCGSGKKYKKCCGMIN